MRWDKEAMRAEAKTVSPISKSVTSLDVVMGSTAVTNNGHWISVIRDEFLSEHKDRKAASCRRIGEAIAAGEKLRASQKMIKG